MTQPLPTLQDLASAPQALGSIAAGVAPTLQDLAGATGAGVKTAAKSGGGFLHEIESIGRGAEHLAGKTVSNIAQDLINSPAGLYHLGTGLATHPVGTLQDLAKSTVQTVEHPLRRPGDTLLTALGLYGGAGAIVGRAAELGRVAAGVSKIGELGDEAALSSKASQAAQALLHGPPRADRVLKVPGSDQTVPLGKYAKNPGTALLQKGYDKLHETYPNAHLPSTQAGRIQRASMANRLTTDVVAKGELARYRAAYKGLPQTMHDAVRVLGEGAPIEQRIQSIRDELPNLTEKPRLLQESRNEIDRLTELRHTGWIENVTKEFDGEQHTVPQLSANAPEILQKYVEDSRKLSNQREGSLVDAGVLKDESRVRRLLGPLNVIQGRKLPEITSDLEKQIKRHENLGNWQRVQALENQLREHQGQMTLEGNINPAEAPIENRALADSLFRVPYSIKEPNKVAQYLPRWRGGIPTAPSTVTHKFEGGILRGGGGRSNVADLMAESALEALKFTTLKNNRDRILASAQDTPDGIPEQYLQAIRVNHKVTDNPDRLAEELLNIPGDLTEKEADAGGLAYERTRQRYFPTWNDLAKHFPGKSETELRQSLPAGYKYVDKRLLGGLDRGNPLFTAMEVPSVRAGLKWVDRINTAQKAAILYLKPAYAIPNMLGNAALTLAQQGFLAPWNLAKSVTAFHWLGKDDAAAIKTIMGGGETRVLDVRAHNLVTTISHKLAGFYAKGVDDPFRFSSFLHEARLEGFKSKSELHNLLTDPQYANELEGIATRANDELINYERLGPGEQAILRRLVFFYPWVKGSTRYAGQFLMNHPVEAGTVGQAGSKATAQLQQELGSVPAYAEGIFKVGNDKTTGMPLVSNPGAAAILGTPGNLLETLYNLFSSKPNKDLTAAQNLSPVDTALLDLLTGGMGHPGPKGKNFSPLRLAADDVYGGNPLFTFLHFLTNGPNMNGTYPDTSPWHAASRFALLGGLTPRVYNPVMGNYQAYKETHG